MSHVILLTQFYRPADPVHLEQLVACLNRNLDHPTIKQVVLLNEMDYPNLLAEGINYPHDKMTMVNLGSRLTFADAFHYANHRFFDQVCVLANSDIAFDRTLSKAGKLKRGHFLALSRHDQVNGQWQLTSQPIASQDCWAFRTPVEVPGSEIQLGTNGSDNRIAAQIKQAGYSIRNCPSEIKIYHWDSRPDQQKSHSGSPYQGDEPMLGLPPTAIGDKLRYIPLKPLPVPESREDVVNPTIPNLTSPNPTSPNPTSPNPNGDNTD